MFHIRKKLFFIVLSVRIATLQYKKKVYLYSIGICLTKCKSKKIHSPKSSKIWLFVRKVKGQDNLTLLGTSLPALD